MDLTIFLTQRRGGNAVKYTESREGEWDTNEVLKGEEKKKKRALWLERM